ncbi:MAG: pyruvate kinase [Burkholderiales bacterium]|nr:pyruvate kinase [Burkholderiales bacterium]
MITRSDEPGRLLAELEAVRAQVRTTQRALLRTWRAEVVLGPFATSAANLAAYVALRRLDLTELQPRLAALGLSSLGRCEGHVLASLDAVIDALRRMCRRRVLQPDTSRAAAMNDAPQLLKQATDRLLGAPPYPRRTRFMVTLPETAAHDARFVAALVEHGMDCARINAAHDHAEVWAAMAKQVRRAAARHGRAVKILVDLPGPKLRTGPLAPGAAVLHVRVKRDEKGGLLECGRIVLDGSGNAGCAAKRLPGQAEMPGRVSLPAQWVARLRTTDTVAFRDLRGRRRLLRVVKRIDAQQVEVETDRGAYIAPGVVLERRSRAGARERAACGAYDPPPARFRVFTGERLLLSPIADAGRPELRRSDGRISAPAVIGCIEPSVFEHLEAGHAVKIDDGKITAQVERIDRAGAWLRIVHAPPRGATIGADKGLNFPDTRLPAQGLDQRDQNALRFAAGEADIVGYSFVQSGAEMDALHASLAALTRRRIGIIAKIETAAALEHLPGIIVHGASHGPFGVMIARGDLAVEIGYLRLAEVQEELLWLCEAARVPVIWATQVLEGLIKRGAPTRAEITDAATAERAECIMLNKGPFLPEALDTLTNLVGRMSRHQSKKTARFSPLPW